MVAFSFLEQEPLKSQPMNLYWEKRYNTNLTFTLQVSTAMKVLFRSVFMRLCWTWGLGYRQMLSSKSTPMQLRWFTLLSKSFAPQKNRQLSTVSFRQYLVAITMVTVFSSLISETNGGSRSSLVSWQGQGWWLLSMLDTFCAYYSHLCCFIVYVKKTTNIHLEL